MMRFSLQLRSLTSCVFVLLASVAAHGQPDPPGSFDLRDVDGADYVTAVKFQSAGTCWTHGAMAAIEGNLLMTGLWAAAGETGEPDLAEYHLDWWNGFNSFYNEDTEPPTGGGITVHMGGDYMVTSAYLARGEGAVRDIDGQSFDLPPERTNPDYHYYYVRDIEWFESGFTHDNMNTIKQAIMSHGVMGTCMCAAADLMSEDYTHYQPPMDVREPNHAIAIVGWSDTKQTQAPLSGAWLCKNSYGYEWGLGGFFWISYYDKHCCQHPEMGAISFQNAEPMKYDRIYYHDYHGWRDTKSGCIETFNAFTALGSVYGYELIEAVSFFTATDSVSYTARVYDRFEGGELLDVLSERSGIADHRGFHTVDLDSVVKLSTGDDFYVYLFLSEGGHPFDRTSEVPVLLGAKYRTTVESTANPGESYYKAGSTWHDLYYDGDTTANFCIKALSTELLPLDISIPDGPIGIIEPGIPVTFTVEIKEGSESYIPGTATFQYRFNEGEFLASSLTQIGADLYEATLPAAGCDAGPEFFISAVGDSGTTICSPLDAPDSLHTALVGWTEVLFHDDFETDLGWIAENLGATSGDWERGIPVDDPDCWYDPHSDADGSGQCYLTYNDYGDTDVDFGAVRLISPIIDLSQGVDVVITFQYYMYVNNGWTTEDRMVVEVSNSGGVGEWAEIAVFDTCHLKAWLPYQITEAELISAGVPPTSEIQIRFTVNDDDPPGVVEAGLDDFWIVYVACEESTPHVPTLITPLNRSITDDNTPEFCWSATADQGGTYTLEHSQDSTFMTGTIVTTDLTETDFSPAVGDKLCNGIWYWHVQAVDSTHNESGFQTAPFSFTVDAALCGDADGSVEVDIDDVVYIINYIFSGGPEPVPYESGDADCSGGIDIDDVVHLIGYIFSGGFDPCDTDGDQSPDC